MKTTTLTSLFLGAALAFTSPLVLAGNMKSEPGQMVKVLNDLKAKGYTIVKKVEFNDNNGDYKADVVNAEGKNLEITVNPKTGKMVKPKDDITGWTAFEIAKKVNNAGYKNIYEINTELLGHEYKIKALSEKGEKIIIKADVETGKITKISE